MKLPSEAEIIALHRKCAPSQNAFDIVYTHCQIIFDIAEELTEARKLLVDRSFIKAAALLHDVGYYSLFDASGYVPRELTITHGIVGAKLLREVGMSESIARVAERHTGVGLTKDHILAMKLPLPPRDLIPETPEERLILYADKFHTKFVQQGDSRDDLGRFLSADTYLQFAARFGPDNAARFRALLRQYGEPDLERLSKKYEQPIE